MVAADDCLAILAELRADADGDTDIKRRKRIVLIYRVKLAMIKKNVSFLSDIIDRCTADQKVDALTMACIFACINAEEEEQDAAAPSGSSSSALREVRIMSLKGIERFTE